MGRTLDLRAEAAGSNPGDVTFGLRPREFAVRPLQLTPTASLRTRPCRTGSGRTGSGGWEWWEWSHWEWPHSPASHALRAFRCVGLVAVGLAALRFLAFAAVVERPLALAAVVERTCAGASGSRSGKRDRAICHPSQPRCDQAQRGCDPSRAVRRFARPRSEPSQDRGLS